MHPIIGRIFPLSVLTNPSYLLCAFLNFCNLFFSGRYDSYQSAYREIKDSLECKLQAKMDNGELSPKSRQNRGNRGRRGGGGRWREWQRSRWRSWDKGDGEGASGASASAFVKSQSPEVGALLEGLKDGMFLSRQVQQLKQLTDLMELVAGGADDVSFRWDVGE